MNLEMYQKNEAILSYLLEKRKNYPDLKFTLRRSNRFRRLLNGYWFYGNNDYLAISFWSGSDWKNRTPNIIFIVNREGNTSLEFTSSDSEKKAFFFGEEMPAYIEDLKKSGKYLRKNYAKFGQDYLGSLDHFLANDKKIIDNVIDGYADKYFEESDSTYNRVGFISDEDFLMRLENVLRYRKDFKIRQVLAPDISLRSLKIENLHPIKSIDILNIPFDAHWIFLTGFNGMGKSSILKSITAALVENYDHDKQIIQEPGFTIEVNLHVNGEIKPVHINDSTVKKMEVTLPSIALAAYGTTRLNIYEVDKLPKEEIAEKTSLAYSMFHTDGLLINLKEQFLGMWLQREEEKTTYSEIALDRINQIVELLYELIPSLAEIKLPENTIEGVWEETKFIEVDSDGNRYDAVEFENLASGIRSMVAMCGDMLLRLFAQQQDVSDPSELRGIVIIDELDIHLHPSLQKSFVELLTGILPRVQFIASTHSPIPFLGAPENSIIYTVTRNVEHGVVMSEVKGVDFKTMLPNTLLTSPIFGMDDLTPFGDINRKKINVDIDYNETLLMNLVDGEIDILFKKGKWLETEWFKKK